MRDSLVQRVKNICSDSLMNVQNLLFRLGQTRVKIHLQRLKYEQGKNMSDQKELLYLGCKNTDCNYLKYLCGSNFAVSTFLF